MPSNPFGLLSLPSLPLTISLSSNFANLDTLVSVALVLKDIPLEHIVFVQYPSRTGVGGIYTGKVAPI